jgi:hypothetical protein
MLQHWGERDQERTIGDSLIEYICVVFSLLLLAGHILYIIRMWAF